MAIQYIVSACLADCKCRYDGSSTPDATVMQLIREGRALPVCPEQLGGLATPRPPAERRVDAILGNDGTDCTQAFINGAEETVKLALLAGCTTAILKSRSPSCGFGMIYDGTFSGRLINGNGIAAEKLAAAGLTVYTDDTFPGLDSTS